MPDFHVTLLGIVVPPAGAPVARLRVEQRGPLYYTIIVAEPLSDIEWRGGPGSGWDSLLDLTSSISSRVVERLRKEERRHG